jgi:hypothetical protein
MVFLLAYQFCQNFFNTWFKQFGVLTDYIHSIPDLSNFPTHSNGGGNLHVGLQIVSLTYAIASEYICWNSDIILQKLLMFLFLLFV